MIEYIYNKNNLNGCSFPKSLCSWNPQVRLGDFGILDMISRSKLEYSYYNFTFD